jgi:hypothetical protein
MESIRVHHDDAHHQATCHAFDTIPHFFCVCIVTVVVRILVALGDNLVFLLFPSWTSRMRRAGYGTMEVFMTDLWEGL